MSTETRGFAGISRLSAAEIRVLGALLEKQRTVPDQYPLSLNSLRLACNQSTNRDPVVQYDEATIRDALHRLERRGYTRLASGAGSRAAKYRHLLAERLPMAHDEQAVMCVLMLRGPQTPGELKQRTDRMHPFATLAEVHETLERLIGRELVARLERQPGQKEERYLQLLEDRDEESGAAVNGHAGSPTVAQPSAPPPADMSGDVAGALRELGERVARLEAELAELRAERRADTAESGGPTEPPRTAAPGGADEAAESLAPTVPAAPVEPAEPAAPASPWR